MQTYQRKLPLHVLACKPLPILRNQVEVATYSRFPIPFRSLPCLLPVYFCLLILEIPPHACSAEDEKHSAVQRKRAHAVLRFNLLDRSRPPC